MLRQLSDHLSCISMYLMRNHYGKSYHIWASTQENRSSGVSKQQRLGQPAHPRSLISAFVIRLLESIISRLATFGISIFYHVYLVSVTEQARFNLILPETPKAGRR